MEGHLIGSVEREEFESELFAWNWIHETFNGKQWYHDHEASKSAGYEVYRDVDEYYNYVCCLGDRLEVNLKEGNQTINLWIVDNSIAEATKTYNLSDREVDIICNRIYKVIASLASDDVGKCKYEHTRTIIEDLNLMHKLRDIKEGIKDDRKTKVCQHTK